MSALQLNITEANHNLDRFSDMVHRVESAMPFTWVEYISFRNSVEELYSLQKSSLESLRSTESPLADLVLVDSAKIYNFLDSKRYKLLYEYRDYLKNRLRLSRELNQETRQFHTFKTSTVFWIINFVATMKVRHVNGKNIKLAKSQLRKLNFILKKLDNYSLQEPLHSDFRELSADEVWDNRCKAYDYLV